MAVIASMLMSRQVQACTTTPDGFIDEDSCYVPFWNTRTGVIIKWSVLLGIVLLCGLYLILGYMHAQRRIQKGLPPLAYHRFLVSRATLAQVDPRYRHPAATVTPYTPESHYYDMHAVPPPVYDPDAPRPPKYEPPAGSTKAESNQQYGGEQSQQPSGGPAEYAPPEGPPPSFVQSQETYAPPPRPPPSTLQPQGTGNANPSRS
ncbi:hypothetical protein VTK56DRAFT_4570 [Thermocarpiscus australiensis]